MLVEKEIINFYLSSFNLGESKGACEGGSPDNERGEEAVREWRAGGVEQPYWLEENPSGSVAERI